MYLATAKEFPVSQGMSGGLMNIKPDACASCIGTRTPTNGTIICAARPRCCCSVPPGAPRCRISGPAT
jgi:hypothetical protein